MAVFLSTIMLFVGVASSSIAEGETVSEEAQEKALKHQELGNRYDDQGEFDKAIDEYKKSLEYMSEDPNTLFNLGVVYLKTNKPMDGVEVFKKLNKLLPEDYEVYNLLGIAYSGAGKKPEAIEAWENSLSIQKDQPRVKEMIAELKTTLAQEN